MKLHLDSTPSALRISGYGAGYVAINERRIAHSLIVSHDTLIDDWAPGCADELDRGALDRVLALDPAIVLLGTGIRQCFPDPALLVGFSRRSVGVEIMDTAAACRTYNVLVGERPGVVAALVVNAP